MGEECYHKGYRYYLEEGRGSGIWGLRRIIRKNLSNGQTEEVGNGKAVYLWSEGGHLYSLGGHGTHKDKKRRAWILKESNRGKWGDCGKEQPDQRHVTDIVSRFTKHD